MTELLEKMRIQTEEFRGRLDSLIRFLRETEQSLPGSNLSVKIKSDILELIDLNFAAQQVIREEINNLQ